mmetsp:Transcript_7394/g.14625  ORF Transcript_7394/g.14625 Transcript_7394/m.14625 type:complete len:204 (+) Transcript_7394:1776-2387(+)
MSSETSRYRERTSTTSAPLTLSKCWTLDSYRSLASWPAGLPGWYAMPHRVARKSRCWPPSPPPRARPWSALGTAPSSRALTSSSWATPWSAMEWFWIRVLAAPSMFPARREWRVDLGSVVVGVKAVRTCCRSFLSSGSVEPLSRFMQTRPRSVLGMSSLPGLAALMPARQTRADVMGGEPGRKVRREIREVSTGGVCRWVAMV